MNLPTRQAWLLGELVELPYHPTSIVGQLLERHPTWGPDELAATALDDRSIHSVACPDERCGAGPGVRCRNLRTGQPLTYWHDRRADTALAALQRQVASTETSAEHIDPSCPFP